MEVIGLRVVDEVLHWVVSTGPLPGPQEPDELARELAGVRGGAQPGVVLHSTSWRHTGAELIVTYALFPDLRAGAGQPLRLHLVTGPGPLEPSPLQVAAEHVAAHAVRHLAAWRLTATRTWWPAPANAPTPGSCSPGTPAPCTSSTS